MADLALVTSNKINLEESIVQHTAPAGANIVAGQAVAISGSNGRLILAVDARVFGIALRTVRTGEPLTVLRLGVIDGYDLSGLAWDASVYLNPVNGNLGDAAGTPSVVVGRVIGGHYNLLGRPADKLLFVQC